MPEPTSPTPTPATVPAPNLPFETVLTIISNSTRWRILRELAGGSLMNSELATRCDCAPDAMSKQLAVLRKAGLVINPRGRLFELAPQFLAAKDQRLLDLGYCTLRLDTAP
jgi:DNA-binding transcriptional ArsR family regulator